MTHTLAIAQLAETLARVLRVNQDLTQAIALAHDIGHPPFGHGGEEALRELMSNQGGFEHNLQTLRIVQKLEAHSPGFRGLNLTYEVREGLARHKTQYDSPCVPSAFRKYDMPPLEAQIVNIADPVAFLAHDLEDAIWMKLIREEDLDNAALAIWDECKEQVREQIGTTDLPPLIVPLSKLESRG